MCSFVNGLGGGEEGEERGIVDVFAGVGGLTFGQGGEDLYGWIVGCCEEGADLVGVGID